MGFELVVRGFFLSGRPAALLRRAPSEPCVRLVTAHGSSKPRGRHGLLDSPAFAGLKAAVAGGVYQACSVPVRRVVSPVMGEVVGADRPSGGAQPPSFPVVRGLGWLIRAQQVVSAQGTAAVLPGEQAGVVAVEGGFDLASSCDPVDAQWRPTAFVDTSIMPPEEFLCQIHTRIRRV
jgi:hypothetical protein